MRTGQDNKKVTKV